MHTNKCNTKNAFKFPFVQFKPTNRFAEGPRGKREESTVSFLLDFRGWSFRKAINTSVCVCGTACLKNDFGEKTIGEFLTSALCNSLPLQLPVEESAP